MTQQMPLFHAPKIDFMKTAAETALPEDPNMWQDEVLQEIYKQVPYLADFALEVVMETVDGERGYGLGHVEVTSKSEAPMTSPPEQQEAAGIRKARIPVIIKDGKLTPFDVVITDDAKAMPLTESRMRQAMFRPHAFDVTSKTPGDQSMIGQLYPPYRQNYGFGGGGVAMSAGMGGKTASKKIASLDDYMEHLADEYKATQAMSDLTAAAEKVASTGSKVDVKVEKKPLAKLESEAKDEKDSCGYKMGSILEAVLPTANVSDLHNFKSSLLEHGVKEAYLLNAATYEAVERISKAEPTTVEKRAAAILSSIKPSVFQVVKLADGYQIKTATHLAWRPFIEHVDRGELVRRVGVKVALAADMSGSATVGADEGIAEDAEQPPVPAGPISAPGMYLVKSTDGSDLTGVVIPNLIDIDGKALPISLFTDGSSATVQSDMVGVPIGEYSPPATVPAEQAQGHGCFYIEYGGIPCATLPLTLGATLAGNEEEGGMSKFDAETFDGRPVQVSVQPYVQQVVNVDGLMLIPQTWSWMPLDQAAEVEISETATDAKTASMKHALSTIQVVAGSADSFAVRGHTVDKLAMDERQFLNQDECLFLLVGLGARPDYAQQKMAHALGTGTPQQMHITHALKLAGEVSGESYLNAERFLSEVPQYRHRMWKEAAAITDPVAVDSVLSLGFINPENLATYVGYLPTLDEAQRRLCELLIGARLGMRELSEGAIERAIRAMEDVIEGLKVIAFQG